MRLSKVKVAEIKENEFIACGLVNAKNRMGGYDGRKPFGVRFIVSLEWGTLITIASSDAEKLLLVPICSHHGVGLE